MPINPKTIDLHSHTYYSDGYLSPTALLTLAQQQGCETLCLCDHDTIIGLDEAQKTADLLGINLIHGVEISALWQTQTIHIIGLNIDKNNQQLQEGLKKHQDFRQIRAQQMAKGLEKSGIKNAYEKTKNIIPSPIDKPMITRTHFAQMLISEGICRNMSAVFKRFLTGNKPGSIKPQWQSMTEVIDWIHQAGGLAVLAHPFRYRFSRAKIRRMLSDFKSLNGDGLEVVVPSSDELEIKQAENFAKDYDLLASQGSDYHGWAGQYCHLARLKPMPEGLKTVWSVL